MNNNNKKTIERIEILHGLSVSLGICLGINNKIFMRSFEYPSLYPQLLMLFVCFISFAFVYIYFVFFMKDFCLLFSFPLISFGFICLSIYTTDRSLEIHFPPPHPRPYSPSDCNLNCKCVSSFLMYCIRFTGK